MSAAANQAAVGARVRAHCVRYVVVSKLGNKLVGADDDMQLSQADPSVSAASTCCRLEELDTWKSTARVERVLPDRATNSASRSPPTNHRRDGRAAASGCLDPEVVLSAPASGEPGQSRGWYIGFRAQGWRMVDFAGVMVAS